MKPKNGENERSALNRDNSFLKLVIIGQISFIAALIVLLGYFLINQRTVVVPPDVRKPYEIGAHYASKDYLLDMADYVLSQVLTVTPESVDYNNKIILKMTHPDGYPVLKTTLEAAAMRIKQDRITTLWIPRNAIPSEANNSVVVSGRLKTFIADKLTSEHDKDYLVQFTVTASGRLYVSKVEEVIKPVPGSKPAGVASN